MTSPEKAGASPGLSCCRIGHHHPPRCSTRNLKVVFTPPHPIYSQVSAFSTPKCLVRSPCLCGSSHHHLSPGPVLQQPHWPPLPHCSPFTWQPESDFKVCQIWPLLCSKLVFGSPSPLGQNPILCRGPKAPQVLAFAGLTSLVSSRPVLSLDLSALQFVWHLFTHSLYSIHRDSSHPLQGLGTRLK